MCVCYYLGLSDLRNVTGFFKRKNNWILSLFALGIPLGPGRIGIEHANSFTPDNVGLNPVC